MVKQLYSWFRKYLPLFTHTEVNNCEIFLFANKHCILFNITINVMHNDNNRDNAFCYYNIHIFVDFQLSYN